MNGQLQQTMEDSDSDSTLRPDEDDLKNYMFWSMDEDITRDDLIKLIKSNNHIDKEKLNVLFEDILEKGEEEVEFFEFLLTNGYKISALNDKKMTIIHSAFYHNHYPILSLSELYIPNLDDDMDYTDSNGLTHLHVACTQNDIAFAEKCFKSNYMNVNAVFHCDPSKSRSGFTALHFAMMKGAFSIIKLLLEHGANVNAKDDFGRTPLHLACRIFKDYNDEVSNTYVDIMEILLKNGADIEAEDKKGNTPLLSIITNDYNEFKLNIHSISTLPIKETKLKFEFLLKAGADVTKRNSHGDTLLHMLVDSLYFLRHWEKGVSFDDSGVVDLIESALNLNSKIEINAENYRGRTPLQLAVWFKSVDVVKALLQRNASFDNIKLTIKDGNFLYYPNVFPNLEAVMGIIEITEMFVDKGIELTADENLTILKFLVHDVDNCECGAIIFGKFLPDAPHLVKLMNYGSPTHAESIFERTMAKLVNVQTLVGHHIATDVYVRNAGALYVNKQLLNKVWKILQQKTICLPFADVQAEVTHMTSSKIADNVTLYDLMCKHPYSIHQYLQNTDVKSFAETFVYHKEIMKGHVTQSIIRNYAENISYLYLKKTMFSALPDVCYRVLLNYLSNEDILRACIACAV